MSQTLEDRLIGLDLSPPKGFVPRVLQASVQPALPLRRSRPLFVAVGATLLALLILASSVYAAPRFADALASAPVIGGPTSSFLRSVGLEPIGARLTPVNDVAVSSGYRVQLAGVYADASQTILLLQVNPPASVVNPDEVSLSDQFGRNLQFRSASYDFQSGAQVLTFEPLGWPDSVLGARLSLRITALEANPEVGIKTPGTWTLHGQVGIQPKVELARPTDGRIGGTQFSFNSIVRSGPAVEVDMHVSGPLATHLTDAVGKEIPNVSKPQPAFNVRLFDATGAEVQPIGGNMSSQLGYEDVRFLWLATKPGTYRLVVSYEGQGQFEREIDVP